MSAEIDRKGTWGKNKKQWSLERATRKGREWECHRIMVGAEIGIGDWGRNEFVELGEVIQKGTGKSRDQGILQDKWLIVVLYMKIIGFHIKETVPAFMRRVSPGI